VRHHPPRWRWPLVLALAGLVVAVQPVHAQAAPAGPAPLPGFGELVSNPGNWLTSMFNAALVNLGRQTTHDAADFMTWMLGNGNVISQTPAGLSYDNDAVKRLWGTMRTVANAGLAVATAWGGVNMMVHPHIRAPYHGALELLPRVVLSGIMVNTSLDWGRFVVDLNNALCQTIGTTTMPAWTNLIAPPEAGAVLMNLIGVAIYLFMGLLLLGQMLMRLALLDGLLVIGPLALLCWVLPQTYTWARLWFSTLFGTVFVQSIQVLVLRLGADLIQRLPTTLPAVAADPVEQARAWLATLLLGIAVLQLARKIPRLIPGLAVGGFPMAPRPDSGAARDIASLVRLASAARGKR
jgi:TrbL/VirB6 plasmid conjugal transfer protein